MRPFSLLVTDGFLIKGIFRPLINDFLRKMAKFRHQENQDVSAGTRIRFFIKNPNEPARFIGIMAVTKEGEAADVKHCLDENKISEEVQYDRLYAVCTDLLDDEVGNILKVSESRWQIEECFRIMKTDFSASPVYLQDENQINAHSLICFLALMIYRFLEKKLNSKYTCEELLDTLKEINFAEIQEQGFIPLYKRETITDDLHEICGFRTNYQFISKSKIRNIQKKVREKNKLL